MNFAIVSGCRGHLIKVMARNLLTHSLPPSLTHSLDYSLIQKIRKSQKNLFYSIPIASEYYVSPNGDLDL